MTVCVWVDSNVVTDCCVLYATVDAGVVTLYVYKFDFNVVADCSIFPRYPSGDTDILTLYMCRLTVMW